MKIQICWLHNCNLFIMVKQKVDGWLISTIAALVAQYNKMGLRASGKYEKELEPFSTFSDSHINCGIKGAFHSQFMENGRLPNTNQDVDSLRAFVGWAGSTFLADWVEQKNLSINPFAAAWKIAREGIPVPNANNPGGVISDVINEKRVNELINDMGQVFSIQIKSDVIKTIK